MYRSRRNKWISGVCGGIAEQAGLPPFAVRTLVALAAMIVPGVTIWMVLVAYIAAAMLLPWKDEMNGTR